MGIIVEAVGSIVAQKDGPEQRAVEQAMVRGIERAVADGVALSDREAIRQYQEEEIEKLKHGV